MRELVNDLKGIELAIFDLDGVVYRGQDLIINVDKIIQELKDMSIQVVYNSNNSTITRQMYVERLNGLNIPCNFNDFYTSASITAAEITKIKTKAKIYVIGEIGLKEELKSFGHEIIQKEAQYNEVDFVIVGLDIRFNYKKIMMAQRCILDGHAQFYATNPDTTLPMTNRLWPGAGVMVNAVQTCTGRPPVKIFGKPEPFGMESILKDLEITPHKACMFGDRLDTDILAGNRAGIITAAVLTGVTTRKMIEELKKKTREIDENLIPNLVIDTLDEVFK